MQAVSASPANINSGKQFVSSLLAEGGTEIVAAMGHALSHRLDKNRLTQIILMTDGAVGNEDALFALIQDQIQLSRLFIVGIALVFATANCAPNTVLADTNSFSCSICIKDALCFILLLDTDRSGFILFFAL